jgi:hypothetical protein
MEKLKISCPQPEIELLVLGHQARSLVAIPTAALKQIYFCYRIQRRIERVKKVT